MDKLSQIKWIIDYSLPHRKSTDNYKKINEHVLMFHTDFTKLKYQTLVHWWWVIWIDCFFNINCFFNRPQNTTYFPGVQKGELFWRSCWEGNHLPRKKWGEIWYLAQCCTSFFLFQDRAHTVLMSWADSSKCLKWNQNINYCSKVCDQ